MSSKNTSKYVLTALAAVILCGSLSGQQPTPQRTPWHVSKVFNFTHEGQPGTSMASGIGFALVPNGHNGVVEHVSARCVAPSVLAIIYSEILISANPSSPGQSGTPGSPGQEDTAYHPLHLQTAYSGGVNVYVASQAAKLRVSAPNGWVTFHTSVFNPVSEPAVITCLVSISGYIEKQ